MIANAKHFVVNSQETNRDAVSEDVDERTLFEMYLPPFEGAVTSGLGSIMCSVRQQPSSAHSLVLDRGSGVSTS